MFHPQSNKEVWWRCSRNRNHEWPAKIQHRVNGSGCPYCRHKLPSPENNLASAHPELAAEWHPTRNGSLKPEHVLPQSNKTVWWLCAKGSRHEWRAKIQNRTVHGTGCPYCSGRRASPDHNLATVFPALAEQWHPVLNKDLKPTDVSPHSQLKVWWKPDARHPKPWKARVRDRVPRVRRRSKKRE
jgi:hypothetical protein